MKDADPSADGGHAVGELQIWLAAVPTDTSDLVATLDPNENDRRRRLREAADRDRFTAAAVLLRRVVAEHHDVARSAIEIDRTCDTCGAPHGRPRVVIGGHTSPSDVSVSHAGSVVAVAICSIARVGIDVEPVVDVDRAVVDVACAPEERSAITTGRDFVTVWTRKEAVLKATGTGLRQPPDGVVVSGPTRAPTLLRLGDTPAPRCRLFDLDIDRDHVGAVAVLTAAPIGPTTFDGTRLLTS